MRVFEAAARHENFTRAAIELGMTQAAVSYQVRLLEEQLGIRLFLRDRGRVRLTEAAGAFARTMTGALGSIADAIRLLNETDDRVLVVSCSNTVAIKWLVPRLDGFRALRPDISLRLDITDTLVDFASADGALRTIRVPGQDLHSKMLMPVRAMPMCSPDLLDRFAPTTPADLLGIPLISRNDVWWRAWFKGVGVEVEGEGQGGIRLDSQAAEGAAAIAGHGIAILTPELWRAEIDAGQLVKPFDHSVETGISLWFVCPHERRFTPKLRLFENWLSDQQL